jgi:hypothetical protein
MTGDEFKDLSKLYAKKKLAEEEIVVFKSFTKQVPMLSFDEYVEWVKQFEDFYTVICLCSGGEDEDIHRHLKNDYDDLVKSYQEHHNSSNNSLKEELVEIISAATCYYEYRLNQLFLYKLMGKTNGMSEKTIEDSMNYYRKKRIKWFDLRDNLLTNAHKLVLK